MAISSESMIAPRQPPVATTGALAWARANLFNSIPNGIVTVVLLYLIAQLLSSTLQWALNAPGWAAVQANIRLLMVGPYTSSEVWRIEVGVWIVTLLLGLSAGMYKGIVRSITIGFGGIMVLLIPLVLSLPDSGQPSSNPLPAIVFLIGILLLIAAGYFIGERNPERLKLPVNVMWLLSYPLIMIFLVRGVGPLEPVDTGLWGGLLVTIALSVIGIVGSFPIGVLLALGRRSELPIVKLFCTIYIETIRGVPLISVLFIGSLILPLLLPEGIDAPSGLIRAMVAVTLFSAAYLAENVRGGLQSLPRGQTEAAQALGLNYWQTTFFITLPQALRTVIPALVGQSISLFKDTSLVTIVGLLDLLGIAQQLSRQPEWLGIPGGVFREALVFISIIYFVVCFTMSRVSMRIERNLGVGQR